MHGIGFSWRESDAVRKSPNKILVSFLTGLLFITCIRVFDTEPRESIPEGEQEIPFTVPDSIIHKMDAYLISGVGLRFFETYIKLDSTSSRYHPPLQGCLDHPASCAEFLLYPHYYVTYKLCIPEEQFVDEYIEIVTDSSGCIVRSREVTGVPKCPNNDCWNIFPGIDHDEAVRIAQDAGLEEGIREWEISFHFFSGELMDYVWEIKNTLYRSGTDTTGFVMGGRGVLILADNGDIFHWFQFAQ